MYQIGEVETTHSVIPEDEPDAHRQKVLPSPLQCREALI